MKIRTLLSILLCVFAFTVTEATAQTLHGKASYYGNQFHGRRTSSGAIYNKDSLTCAHKSLPFGTMLRVRNKSNGKEVVVKVTDRGPFAPGRIVDLSRAAASRLGMIASGVVNVEVEVIKSAKRGGAELHSQNNYTIPELELQDPRTGKSYKASEWAKMEGRSGAQASDHPGARYIVHNDKPLASAKR